MGGDEKARKEARQAALQLSFVCLVVGLLGVVLYALRGLPWVAPLVLCALAAACLGLVLAAPRMSRALALTIFCVVVVAAGIAFWIDAEAQAATGRPFVPFDTHKILALVVAMLCPSVLLGVA